MQGKRVFVSGGAGVIGRELVPRLLAAGAIPIVGDLKPRPAHFGAGVIYRQGDLNAMTEAEFHLHAPEVYIHLAATFERSPSAECCATGWCRRAWLARWCRPVFRAR